MTGSFFNRHTMRPGTFCKKPGIQLLLFLLLFVSYGYFFQAGQDNENARFSQLRSITEEGSLAINTFAYTSADVVQYRGKIFPNKAPGSVLLALPIWVGFDFVLKLFGTDSDARLNLLCYLTVWLLIGGATALTAVLIYRICYILLPYNPGPRSSIALLLAVGYGLGTIAFPFSTVFFSHQLAAFLGFAAFYLIFKQACCSKAGRPVSGGILFASGLLLGLGVTTEYPAALIAVALGIYSIFCFRKPGPVLWLVLGGCVALVPLAVYQWAAFGSPFFIPYSAYAAGPAGSFFPDHKVGFMGVSWPKLETLYQITFGLMRGLFVFNPWLILPALSLPFLVRIRQPHWLELLLTVLVVVFFLFFNSGYGGSFVYWGGGASAGPRHLLPMLPFAALMMTFAMRLRPVRIAAALLIPLTILIMLIVTAVEPRAPYESSNPVLNYYLDNFLRGIYALDTSATFSTGLLTADSASFNWGKLQELPGWLQLAPLILFWLLMLQQFINKLTSVHKETVSLCYRTYLLAGFLILVLLPGSLAAWETLHYPGQRGLFAMYYDRIPWSNELSDEFIQTPVDSDRVFHSAIEKHIMIPWGQGEKKLGELFAIEWSGYIRIQENREYIFGTSSDDGSAVYIDGQLVVDNWGIHGRSQKVGRVRLAKGYHAIVVRYYNHGFGRGFELLWTWMDKPLQPVPARYLYVFPKE